MFDTNAQFYKKKPTILKIILIHVGMVIKCKATSFNAALT